MLIVCLVLDGFRFQIYEKAIFVKHVLFGFETKAFEYIAKSNFDFSAHFDD